MQRLGWTTLALGFFATDLVAQESVGTTTTTKPGQSSGTLVPFSTNLTTTVYSNIVGHPTAAVPGIPGLNFDPGTGTTHFDRPFVSPNGNWILTALTDSPTTATDEIMIVNGVVVVREGDPAPYSPGNTIGPFDTKVAINDSGEFAFANNVAPTTTNDDFVIRVTAGNFVVIAQEGAPMASMPGTTYDDALDSVIMLANGTVGFEADLVDGGGVTSTTDEILELGTMVIGQELVTIPGGQALGATETADNFDLDEFWADPSGANVLWGGDLTGLTTGDDVVVLNNTVVLQEGTVIPGMLNPVDGEGIVATQLDAGGNWYVRGNVDVTEDDFVVRNGTVVAAVGLSITPGSAEVWDDTDFSDCFFAHTGNGVGDYLVAGVTNAASTNNGVIVYNGNQVILRENQPVDLDNDGLFDDGLYFSTFGNDDFTLSNSGEVHFTATLRDAGGTTVGQGFFRTQVSICNGGAIEAYGTGCGGTNPIAPKLSVIGCPTPNDTLTFAMTNGLPSSSALLFIGVTAISAPITPSCNLLVSPLITLPVPLDAAGSLTFPAVIPPGTPVIQVYMQGFNVDPGDPKGFASTNGVSFLIQ